MRLHPAVAGLLLASLAVAPAHAARGRAATAAPAPAALEPSAGVPDTVVPAHIVTRAEPLALARAALELSRGNPAGVIEQLEAMDFTGSSRFAGVDRAAFLLAEAWLETGRPDRFLALAHQVATWDRNSLFTRWIEFERALLSADSAGTLDSLAVPGAPEGWSTSLAALHRARGEKPGSVAEDDALARLARCDTTTQLGRDLVGAARLRLATRALERGHDPAEWLAGVPARSRYAGRARLMLATHELERGHGGRAAARLQPLLEGPDDALRRAAHAALGGHALERGDFAAAREHWSAVDQSWRARRDTLERIAATGAFEPLWRDWPGSGADSDMLVLDLPALRSAVRSLVRAAAVSDRAPLGPEPALDTAAPGTPGPAAVPPPPPGEWRAARASAARLAVALDTLASTRRAIAIERGRIADLDRHLAPGATRAADQAAALAATRDALAPHLARAEAVDAELRAVRDAAIARVRRRAAAVIAAAHAIARREQELRPPPAGASPDGPADPLTAARVLAREEALTRTVLEAAEGMAAETPGHIAGSYARAWRPRLVERPLELARRATAAHARAGALRDTLEHVRAVAAASRRLAAALASLPQLERSADSLARADAALRAGIARAAVARALAALEPERAGIDYGLAASAWALGVRLGARDSATGAGDPLDDAEAGRWQREAIAGFERFLARHDSSGARGDVRFRLADLRMVEARRAFRERMAAWTRARDEGRPAGPPPVVDDRPALALYRAILAGDPGYARRDAVLFHTGSLLADAGDPEADALFARLVQEHPGSAHLQETHLRRGDLRFAARRYAECEPFYARAAEGADPSLSTIALYKMGWALEQEGRFLESADAFRSVLDLYQAHGRGVIRADIEDEAETWFVHTLARAGGVRAFDATFKRIGRRPYERRVLLALGQHFRRFERHADAAAADSLALRRWPLDPDALVSATRLVATWERAHRPADASRARRAWAEHFAPGGAWAAAQGPDSVNAAADSLRRAGAAFARDAWETEALALHRGARQRDDRGAWAEAARLYDVLLERWPEDEGARRRHLLAAEARGALGQQDAAHAHAVAASAGQDSIAAAAMWQRVALVDSWYEADRGDGKLGRDSLARAVLSETDTLLARFPGHPKAADLEWRTGNLALAHGEWARAAADFGRIAGEHGQDPRAPRAALLRADALYRSGAWAEAGGAYEQALAVAQRAGVDSLAKRARAALPVAWYRDAEASVAADSGAHAVHAGRFANVAARWPEFEHAHQAQYRAALAWQRAGRPREAIAALETLIERFPGSEYVRDAHLEIANRWSAEGRPDSAALAWTRFAERFPRDTSARHAWLAAATAHDSAGEAGRAEALRLESLERWPDDHALALEVLEPLARRELAALPPERPISTLLPAPAPAGPKAKRGKAATRRAPAAAPAARAGHLARYLERAAAHPGLASPGLIAEVRFREAEERFAACRATALRQPLPTTIARKQAQLDTTLARYRLAADVGVPEWAHASAYRMGEALVEFAEALEQSERPADLTGDDARAYENVLIQKSLPFHDRAEAVWSDLLRRKGASAPDDPWLARARTTLWARLGQRFFFRPEADFPQVLADDSDAKDTNPAPAEPALGAHEGSEP